MMNTANSMYWTSEDAQKLRDIRKGCIDAVQVVLSDYSPSHGLAYVPKPCARDFLRMEKSFEEFEGANSKFVKYQHQCELRERQFGDAIRYISERITAGDYRVAATFCRDNFPTKYADPCVRILAHAVAREAPLHRRSEELSSRVIHARERSRKIKEGIRALFDF